MPPAGAPPLPAGSAAEMAPLPYRDIEELGRPTLDDPRLEPGRRANARRGRLRQRRDRSDSGPRRPPEPMPFTRTARPSRST